FIACTRPSPELASLVRPLPALRGAVFGASCQPYAIAPGQARGQATLRRRAAQHDIGRAIAGADGALDGGRQAGRGPIAGEREVVPPRRGAGALGVLLWRRREGGAAFLDDLPSGERRGEASDLGDFAPDRRGQLLARN